MGISGKLLSSAMGAQEASPDPKFRNPTHFVDKFVLFLFALFIVPNRAALGFIVGIDTEGSRGWESLCVSRDGLHELAGSNPVSNCSGPVDFCF